MRNRKRTLGTALPALAALVLVTALVARAADEPHSRTYVGATSGTNSVCLKCHATHKSAGTDLTTATSNEALCSSCHNLAGIAGNFPLERFYRADYVNNLGSSHAWNAPAANANAGTVTPSSAMKDHMNGANITCSTCHDQHHEVAASPQTAGSQNLAAAVRVAGTGTGTVTYTATAGASGKGYLIEIIEVAGGAGTAKFRLSNDGGLSWFGFNGSAWTAYATGNAAPTGASVVLNDGTNVSATFAGNFVLGDRLRMYVGYPFLRVALDSGDNVTGSKFCRDCHSSWAMDHNGVNVYDGKPKSHPVGVTLNVNGNGYDRAVPLDANGVPQGGAGDGNPANDLKLAGDNTIQCLTCHGVHHATGNSSNPQTP